MLTTDPRLDIFTLQPKCRQEDSMPATGYMLYVLMYLYVNIYKLIPKEYERVSKENVM